VDTDRLEGKAILARLRQMQAELRQLKQEVAAHATSIRSDFTSKRTAVGKTVGPLVAGMIVGRRAVGGVNAINRDKLRLDQERATAPYENLKRVIDDVISALNRAKAGIENSAEYRAPAPSSTITPLKGVT
jgi:hypothetical protein